MWVSNVSACMGGGLANEVEYHTSSERVQAGVRHEGRGYQVPVACGPDEEREFEACLKFSFFFLLCYNIPSVNKDCSLY